MRFTSVRVSAPTHELLQNSKAEKDRTTLEIDKEKIERKIAQDENDHLTKKLQAQLEDLERLLESSGRQATAEVASLYSQIEQLLREIKRLQGLLNAETARRLELAVTLRLAEESIRRAKLVGIGMRITDEAPHRITEIVAGGAAHMSGALQVHTTTHCNTLHHTDTIALNPACLARCRSATTLSKWRILTAKYCNTLHHTTTHCKTLLRTAKHCNTLQHTTGRRLYSESGAFSLPHTASRCNTLQRTAIHCNNLQHTATHRSATTFSKWRRWTLVHFRLLRSEISSWVPLEATWCIYIYI